jgi:hypothetical protein
MMPCLVRQARHLVGYAVSTCNANLWPPYLPDPCLRASPALLLQDGHPKYQRRSLIFERIRLPGGLQPLKRYDPPVPTPGPTVTQQARTATLIADDPNTVPNCRG